MKSIVSIIATALLLTAVGCSKSPLHEPMEEMGDAFGAIREATDLSSVTAEIDAFIQAAKIAQAQEIPAEHKEKFDKGIGLTVELAIQLKSAVETGDMELATETVKKLGQNSKKYHDELGVEK